MPVCHACRLRNTVTKLLHSKQPVKVGVVGGSITYQDGPEPRWFEHLTAYLRTAFPAVEVVAKNGAIPGTPSNYAAMCLEIMVDEDVELVFVEYILNDGFGDGPILANPLGKNYERLLRKLLKKPQMPAVVLMQVCPAPLQSLYDIGL